MAQLVKSKFTWYFARDYITMIMYLASSVHPGAGFYVVFESAELEYILWSVKGSPAFGQCICAELLSFPDQYALK